jgi:soluble lytic murein transglycosylase-like protein
MKNLEVKIPAIDQAFYPDTDVPKIKAKIATIKANYGKFINNSSAISNVPADLIAAFIFIESGGVATAVSGAGAIGLMQIMVNSGTDILTIERQQRRLSDGEKATFLRLVGADRYAKYQKVQMGTLLTTKEDLLDPEFNIFIGTIYLNNLIDRHTEGGKVRLDKVICNYNAGYYAFNKGKNLIGSIDELVLSLNSETSAYITKLLGVNGVLDCIV